MWVPRRRPTEWPMSVALDAAGDLFIAESGSLRDIIGRIRKVSPDGTIGTVYAGQVTAITANAHGDSFFAASMGVTSGLYELSAEGVLSTISDNGALPVVVNGMPASDAYRSSPQWASFDKDGNAATIR
jgi:hypothetical protein